MTGSNALIQFPPFILLNHSLCPAKKKQKQKQNKTTNKQTTTTTSSKTSKQFCNKQRNPVYHSPETSAPSVLSFNLFFPFFFFINVDFLLASNKQKISRVGKNTPDSDQGSKETAG